MDTVIKKGYELKNDELDQINKSLFREFKVSPLKKEDLRNRTFFILKEKENIISMGALLKVEPVYFDNKEFTIYGVVNIVSNKKGQGFGKYIVTSIRSYLANQDFIGLGFCMPQIQGFYENCGFKIEKDSTKRFICVNNGKRITNQDGQVIFSLINL